MTLRGTTCPFCKCLGHPDISETSGWIAANAHSTAFPGTGIPSARSYVGCAPPGTWVRFLSSAVRSRRASGISSPTYGTGSSIAPMRHQTLRLGPMNMRTDSATSLSSLPRRQRLAEVACEQISRPIPFMQFQIPDDRLDGKPFILQ
jgi:hypothetical protein